MRTEARITPDLSSQHSGKGSRSQRAQGSPALTADDMRWLMTEAQRLIDGLELRTIADLRDRAIIGIMGYAQAPVDAVTKMQVRDYYALGDRCWVRLRANGIERYEIVDRRIEPYIDAYLAAAAIADQPLSPLFRVILPGRNQRVGTRSIARRDVLLLIKDLAEGRIPRQHRVTIEQGSLKAQTSTDLMEARFDELIDSINASYVIGARDRAIIGLMLYVSLSPEIISKMLTSHYKTSNGQSYILFDDQRQSIEASPPLAMLMREYLTAARLHRRGEAPLFRSTDSHPMTVSEIRKMIRRRMREARIHHFSET
jgi:site-specific recombinase XerD